MSDPVIESMAEARRHLAIAEEAEEALLNRLADEAESEDMEGAVSLEEMAALLRANPS